jgi:hypothetical protein
MALAFETTYGTPPASGFRRMPFASATLGAEQPLLNSELLGYGRDPLAPIKDAVTADGNVVVPIDAQGFGVWLKAAFGPPLTTGTAAPYTHEFRSGSWTLPSLSIETGMPEVPRFAMYSGCVLDMLSWQMQRSGLLTATAGLVVQGETVAAASAAGTLADVALQRFGRVRVRVEPLTTALMVAARSDPAVHGLPEGTSDDEIAVVFARALAERAILDWEGVGDAEGNPAPVTPEGIAALLDVWPIFEAFQLAYVAKGLELDAEKNASALSPNGSTAGARGTARPARARARTARPG